MDEALKLEKIDGFFEWKKNSGLSLSLCAFGNEMNFAPLPPPPSTYLLDRNVRSQKWSIKAKKSVNREIYRHLLKFFLRSAKYVSAQAIYLSKYFAMDIIYIPIIKII